MHINVTRAEIRSCKLQFRYSSIENRWQGTWTRQAGFIGHACFFSWCHPNSHCDFYTHRKEVFKVKDCKSVAFYDGLLLSFKKYIKMEGCLGTSKMLLPAFLHFYCLFYPMFSFSFHAYHFLLFLRFVASLWLCFSCYISSLLCWYLMFYSNAWLRILRRRLCRSVFVFIIHEFASDIC